MRTTTLGVVLFAGSATAVLAQTTVAAPVEIPLRIEEGRLVVTAQAADGTEADFVFGLGMTLLTESAAARSGSASAEWTVGGIPVDTEMAQTVPDSYLGASMAVAGVIGGLTWNRYNLLIDAPNGRILLAPVGRAVRWPGVPLTSPARLQVFHDVLLRADVDFGGTVVGGLLDLVVPELQVNAPLAAAVSDGRVASFRMGYAGWADLPAVVTDSQTLRGWDRNGEGFVIVGAAIARDCAIAISWVHQEVRTCRTS